MTNSEILSCSIAEWQERARAIRQNTLKTLNEAQEQAETAEIREICREHDKMLRKREK